MRQATVGALIITLTMCGIMLACIGVRAWGQSAKRHVSELDDLAFTRPGARLTAIHQNVNDIRNEVPVERLEAWDTFLSREGSEWVMVYDRVTDRPALIEGRGIPWFTKDGETLVLDGRPISSSDAANNALKDVSRQAEAFLRVYQKLFGVRPEDLELRPDSSGPILDYLLTSPHSLYHPLC